MADKAESRLPAFRMRSLRPVAAKIVSYGREAQAHRRTTLYVLRVSRSGAADWYVAKRYSEFRALHDALQRQFGGADERHVGCGACEELQSFYAQVRFPERHVLSALGFHKKRLDAARMEELDSYMRFLLETTQGLLGDDEGDEDAPEWDADSARCAALELIREFLMVNEDHTTDALGDQDAKKDVTADCASAAVPRRQLRRLNRRSSSVTSFHVTELDLVPVGCEKKNSPMGDSMRNLFAEDWDPMFADVFDECTAPPEDAFIHRQIEDAPLRQRTHPLRLIEGFPRR